MRQSKRRKSQPSQVAERAKWTYEMSDIPLDEINVQNELKKKNSIARKLFKNRRLHDGDGRLKFPEQRCKELRNKLDMFIEDVGSPEQQLEKDLYCEETGYPPKLWFKSEEVMKRKLKAYKEKIFDKYLPIATCEQFPPELVLMLDMACIKESFEVPHVKLIEYEKEKLGKEDSTYVAYEETVLKHDGKPGNFRGPVSWYKAEDGVSENFYLPGPHRNTEFLTEAIAHNLEKHGNMPPDAGKSKDGEMTNAQFIHLNWDLGWLSTSNACEPEEEPSMLQPAHVDYKHKTLHYFRERAKKGSLRGRNQGLPDPWSMDMPNNPNGLRLAFWGTEYPPHKLRTMPIEIVVPPHHVLLWRGDMVHAGALFDPKGGTGFRMHGCLPLVREHIGLGNVAEFCANRRDGTKRYDCDLLRLDGNHYE